MPKYLPSNDGSVIDAIPTPLPDAYGSVDDTRVEDIVQIRDSEQHIPEIDTTTITTAIIDAFNSGQFSQPDPKKQIHRFTTTVGIDATEGLPIKAQSIRIDNLTNQWIFVPLLRLFVPPDWYGAIYTTNGADQITILFQAPPGFIQPAPAADTIVVVVAHAERLPDVAGTKRT